MCTVTYLPLKTGCLITSNRDEMTLRKASSVPLVQSIGGQNALFPKDGEAGGTWFATTENRRTVCLLNGAFVPHQRKPPYKRSRGLVVLDFFKTQTAEEFKQEIDLEGIEPFTLLIAENDKLFEFRWDGLQKYYKVLDEKSPCIYCSVTLYPPEVIALRKQWFEAWLKEHPTFKTADILHFHLFAGEGNEFTNVRMNRYGIVKTISISSVQSSREMQCMYYSALEGEKIFHFRVYTFPGKELNLHQPEAISLQV